MDSTFLMTATAIVSGFLWLMFLRGFEKVDPEPLKVILRVGLLGGLGSGFCAGTLNVLFGELTGSDLAASNLPLGNIVLDAIFVGLNEEAMKFLFTVLLIRHLKEFDEPIDAAIYSTAVALGFAVFENIDYAVTYGYVNLVVRSVTSTPLHLGTAVIWGYGIARAKFLHRERYGRSAFPSVLPAAAVHAFYNFLCSYFDDIDAGLSLLVALGFAFVLFLLLRKRLLFLASQTPFVLASVCLKCGTKSVNGASYCQRCGEKFVHEFFKVCTACDLKLSTQDSYCWKCGSRLLSLEGERGKGERSV